MNQPQSVLTVLFALLMFTASAQRISPYVISAGGGLAINTSGSLSYTIGEMAMIETFSGPSNFLTQGFQQPWDLITAVHDDPQGVGLFVYPNPADNYFYVRTDYDKNIAFSLSLTDVLGQPVVITNHEHNGKTTIQSIYTGHLSAGMYILTLHPESKASTQQLITTKIHITK